MSRTSVGSAFVERDLEEARIACAAAGSSGLFMQDPPLVFLDQARRLAQTVRFFLLEKRTVCYRRVAPL